MNGSKYSCFNYLKKETLLILIPILIGINSCNSQSCTELPKYFSSYKQALDYVRSYSFKIKEKVNTSKSSWIRSAEYYSCDGNYGYFILVTDQKPYIFKDMPLYVWEDFKNAGSFGKYYNENIRGRYKLILKKD